MKQLTVEPVPTPITAAGAHVGERGVADQAPSARPASSRARIVVGAAIGAPDHLLRAHPGVELLGA